MTAALAANLKRRAGARYQLDDQVPVTLEAYDALPHLTSKARALIGHWVASCRADLEGITDDETLKALMKCDRSTLYRHVNLLVKLGCVSKTSAARQGKARAATLYILNPPASALPVETVSATVPAGSFDLGVSARPQNADSLNPAIQRNVVMKAFRHSVLTLAPAFTYGNKSETKREATVWVGNRYVEVVVRAFEDYAVPRVGDLPSLILVHSYHIDARERNGSTNGDQRSCVFWTGDMLREMALPQTARNKQSFYDRLRGFRADIEIVSDVSGVYNELVERGEAEIQEELPLGMPPIVLSPVKVGRKQSFSLVELADVLEVTTNRGKTPEVLAVRLNTDLFPAAKVEGLTVPRELIQQRPDHSEFDLLLYFWLRQNVRHTHTPKYYPLEPAYRTMRAVGPETRVIGTEEFARFRRNLGDLPKRRPGREPNFAQLFGYRVAYDRRSEDFVAYADPDDRILGRHSPYQLNKPSR